MSGIDPIYKIMSIEESFYAFICSLAFAHRKNRILSLVCNISTFLRKTRSSICCCPDQIMIFSALLWIVACFWHVLKAHAKKEEHPRLRNDHGDHDHDVCENASFCACMNACMSCTCAACLTGISCRGAKLIHVQILARDLSSLLFRWCP